MNHGISMDFRIQVREGTEYKKLTGKSLAILRSGTESSVPREFPNPLSNMNNFLIGVYWGRAPCNCLITCDDRGLLNLRTRGHSPIRTFPYIFRETSQTVSNATQGRIALHKMHFSGEGDRFSKIIFHPCIQRRVYIILFIRTYFYSPLLYFKRKVKFFGHLGGMFSLSLL